MHRPRPTRALLAAIAACAWPAATSLAQVPVVTWAVNTSGDWFTPSNWSPSLPGPTNGVIIRALASSVAVSLSTGNASIAVLNCDNTLLLGPNATLNASTTEQFGIFAPGTLTQTGGTNSTTTLYLGTNTGVNGQYTLSAGSLTVAGAPNSVAEGIGINGRGTFTQTGGTHTTLNLCLAYAANSTGTYSLSGSGTLSVIGTLSLTEVNPEYVGQTGTGSFIQTGGTHSSPFIFIGYDPGSTGFYSLSGGTLVAKSSITIGDKGAGSFQQSGGSLTTASLSLPDHATYALSAGSLSATNGMLVANTGTASVTQSGGSATIGSLGLAFAAGSSATYSLSNAASLAVPNTLTIGESGHATFTQSGGTVTTNKFRVAYSSGSSATYALSAGSLTVATGGDDIVGQGGSATFLHTGGSHAADSLFLAYNSLSSANYSLSGSGSLTLTNLLDVGAAASATFTRSGGTVSAGTRSRGSAIGGVALGEHAGASGSYALSAGSLNATALYVGFAGAGTFAQTGGTATISNGIFIGNAINPAATGQLTVANSASLSTPSLDLYDANANALYLTGGTLAVTTVDVHANPGRFHWTGGTLRFLAGFSVDPAFPTGPAPTLAPGMTLVSSAPSSIAGSITLAGGTLDAASLPLTNNGSITASAGSLTAGPLTGTGSLTLSSPAASATFSSIRQSSLTNAGSITLRPAAQGGDTSVVNALTLNPGSSLDLADNPLLVISSPADQIRQYLHDARLTSSAADPTRSLGYIFNGNPAAPTSITVRLTPTGDANLDGQLDADDFTLLDKGYATAGTTWWQGDFNYDGQVTPADYLLLDSNYLAAHPPSPTFLSTRESKFGQTYVTSLLASLPEPSLLAACGLALPLLPRRKSRP